MADGDPMDGASSSHAPSVTVRGHEQAMHEEANEEEEVEHARVILQSEVRQL